MSFKELFNDNEIKLLEDIGINIVNDKTYSRPEIKQCISAIEGYIMNHSTKNGDIRKAINKYSHILDIFNSQL